MGRASAGNAHSARAMRCGYRGWLVTPLVIDEQVKCEVSRLENIARKLARYPQPLFWPVAGDVDGAKLMLDAVLAEDVARLKTLHARHAEHVFGWEDSQWWDTLQKAHEAVLRIQIRTLRTHALAEGRTLRIELETDSQSGRRAVVASVYRGRGTTATRSVRALLFTDAPSVQRASAAASKAMPKAMPKRKAVANPSPPLATTTLAIHAEQA